MTTVVLLFRNNLPRAPLIYFAVSFGSSCLQCNEFVKLTYATLKITNNWNMIERGFNYFHTQNVNVTPFAPLHVERLTQNLIRNQAVSVISGQKPCTRIISILQCFAFSKSKI